jgi:hypothetical protein
MNTVETTVRSDVMKDRNFFRVMGVLQLLIAFINFYVAMSVVKSDLGLLNLAVAALCVTAGVFCCVSALKMWGALD